MMKFIPMQLHQLEIVSAYHKSAHLTVTGISSDSRQVNAGDLFVARDGVNHRGIDFIEQAALAGAVAVVIDHQAVLTEDLSRFPIPVFPVKDLSSKVGVLAALMLDKPSTKMTIIGITGTNGKTSCAHYIAQALIALGQKTALIGTVGNGFPEALDTATHTTPDAISLQRMLADFHSRGAKAVVMEVSSHALDQGRVAGVEFDVVALTNLSRDHLDYHGSMDAYADAKAQLFLVQNQTSDNSESNRRIVLNADDEFGRKLADQLTVSGQFFSCFSQSHSTPKEWRVNAAITLNQAVLTPQGVALHITMPDGDIRFDAPVVGDFNVSNLLLVVSVLHQLTLSCAQIESVMATVSAVPGRMECLVKTGFPAVVIDYAHTPDALEKALLAARKHCQKKLWIVFGCGGDRDTGKRTEMAAIAEQLADNIIVTSDNPRTESPELIIEMIMQGFKDADHVIMLPDREAAITSAIQMANPDDLILIAGKGHEDYQEIMGIKYPFSDKNIAEKLMGVRSDDGK